MKQLKLSITSEVTTLLLFTFALGFFVFCPNAQAVPPNPIVSSIFVPIEGDITEPGTTNLVHLIGEVHVLTQVTFSDVGLPAVPVTELVPRTRTRLAQICVPEQQLSFTLVSLETQPGPPNPVLPIFLRNFIFGVENTNWGELQTVEASFLSE